jgi:hypothetical protein
MALIDYIRGEYVNGKVIDKYRLSNGNLGLLVEQNGTSMRYHVEFKDGYKGPGIDNVFGLAKEPFAKKTESLNRLINKGDSIELTASYARNPFRQAYKIYSISRPKNHQKPSNIIRLPYRNVRKYHY